MHVQLLIRISIYLLHLLHPQVIGIIGLIIGVFGLINLIWHQIFHIMANLACQQFLLLIIYLRSLTSAMLSLATLLVGGLVACLNWILNECAVCIKGAHNVSNLEICWALELSDHVLCASFIRLQWRIAGSMEIRQK